MVDCGGMGKFVSHPVEIKPPRGECREGRREMNYFLALDLFFLALFAFRFATVCFGMIQSLMKVISFSSTYLLVSV
jgi:hypothetical protein